MRHLLVRFKRNIKNFAKEAGIREFSAKYFDPIRAVYRTHGIIQGFKLIFYLTFQEIMCKFSDLAKHEINLEDCIAARKSDTVFIFGSGSSLKGLTNSDWERISEHDVMGLNYFVHQNWVDVDFHFIRELSVDGADQNRTFNPKRIASAVVDFFELAATNGRYTNTIFFVQKDFFSTVGKLILILKMFTFNQRFLLYAGQRGLDAKDSLPSCLKDGISRKAGAIGAGISIAKILEWKTIVLVGVDLYDSKYFWLPEHAMRNNYIVDGKRQLSSSEQKHPTIERDIINIIRHWNDELGKNGVRLLCYNPRSLLVETLEVFSWEQ